MKTERKPSAGRCASSSSILKTGYLEVIDPLSTCGCRYWARRRGIYSNIVGFFGGTSFASNADWLKLQCCAARKLHASMFLWLSLRRITWSLLVARICQRLSNPTEESVPFYGRSNWRSAISILCAQPIGEQAQRWAHVLHFSLCEVKFEELCTCPGSIASTVTGFSACTTNGSGIGRGACRVGANAPKISNV